MENDLGSFENLQRHNQYMQYYSFMLNKTSSKEAQTLNKKVLSKKVTPPIRYDSDNIILITSLNFDWRIKLPSKKGAKTIFKTKV